VPIPKVRVLVVDDFEEFRRYVASTLREQPELQVICEASDGLEAVQKAAELQPDLIVLDIGLPKLNGLRAAEQILKLSPKSRILFLSVESSPDMVQAAFSAGAWGYVVKMDAENDLIAAIAAVLRGKKFVGSRFAEYNFTDPSALPISNGLHSHESHVSPAPIFSLRKQKASCHELLLYSDDASLVDGFTQFVGERLKAGGAVIVVATELHRDLLLSGLHVQGVDVGAAIKEGRYIPLDAAETLAMVMVDGMPDPVLFSRIGGTLILGTARAANIEPRRVAACGECVPLLGGEAAVSLEQLWNKVISKYGGDVLCGYPRRSLEDATERDDAGRTLFERICAEHSVVHSR
jgi:DNA-binding NarL/FixJ family response regulator